MVLKKIRTIKTYDLETQLGFILKNPLVDSEDDITKIVMIETGHRPVEYVIFYRERTDK